jgi:hypothetical protein
MSSGVPPPNSTAQLLGMYAGSISQIAVIVAVISGIIVLLFGSRIIFHIYLIIRALEGEGL